MQSGSAVLLCVCVVLSQHHPDGIAPCGWTGAPMMSLLQTEALA